MKTKVTQKIETLAIHNPANYPTTKEKFEKMWEEWFLSEEGELVRPAREVDGYIFGEERRTYEEDGSSSIRCKITLPNGQIQWHITKGGCWSPVGGAEFGDDCGCEECQAWIKSQELVNN